MEAFKYQLSGTLDRGDGEADLSFDPPPCPEHCGGDLYRDGAIWRCSDASYNTCAGAWDDEGEELT